MTEQRFTLPAGREPTDAEVLSAQIFLQGEDWFSDYDCGISLNLGDGEEMARVGPGQTIVRHPNGRLTIEGEEVPCA